jgi:hypothetical protein
MFTQTSNFCVKPLAFIILFGLSFGGLTNDKLKAEADPLSAQKTKAEFIPPKGSGIPKDPTTAGGTRPINCNDVYSCLIPLLPATTTKQLDYYPLTVSERPTVYVSLPRTSGTAVFTLYQHMPSAIKKIHRFSFPVKTSGGIISIAIPPSSPALQNDNTYEWTLSLNNESANGLVRRVQLKPSLKQKISQAKPLEKLAIYAAEGIWYDSVATLAELRSANPFDRNIFTAWSVFLDSVNLSGKLTKQNFISCCQVEDYSALR